MRVEVSLARSPNGATATITGELDSATTPDAEATLLPACSTPGAIVELDLSGVTFCGSAGLSMLLALRNAAGAAGVRLVLARTSRAVDRLLDITGTAGSFTRG
jgi:anti-sigma B factor antagonist